MRLTTRDHAFAVMLAACVAVMAWQRVVPTVVGTYNDDGVYVLTAKALATGQGYRLLQLPGEPFQTKYPPLFPSLLAVAWWMDPVFPGNVLGLKVLGVAFTAVGAGGLWLLLVRFGYASRHAAALGVAAGVCAPRMLYLVSVPLSETLFLPLLVAAGWMAERAASEDRPAGWRASAAGGLLVAALVLTRSAGLFVAAGVVLSLAARRRLSLAYAACAIVPVVGWHAVSMVTASAPAALQDAYNVDYVSWWRRLIVEAPWQVVLVNAAAFVFGVGAVESDGFTQQAPVPAQVAPWVVIASLLTWGAAIVALRRRGARPLVAGLAAYLGVVLCWPWQPLRFLVVVMPIVFSLALDTALSVPGTRVARRAVGGMAIAAVSVVLVTGAVASWRVGQASRATGYPMMTANDPPIPWSRFEEAFAAVGRLTPPDAVVASVVDPMVQLYASRKSQFAYEMDSIALFYRADAGWMTAERLASYWRERKVTHVLRMPVATWKYPALDAAIDELKRSQPATYRTVWSGASADFELIAVAGGDELSSLGGARPPFASGAMSRGSALRTQEGARRTR